MGINEVLNVLSGGLRYITAVSPNRLTETQARLSTAILLFVCYGYTEFDPTGLKHSGHEAILRALVKGLSFTQKCLQLGLIDNSQPIMSCIKEPMTAIKDTKPVYDLYTSSIEDWHREILAKIPGQPNTTQARSGSTVFEITNHMLGISLLKGNALSYAADSDLFRLFGQDQNQTEFLTIYATDPKNNLNRYTYSPSQWTEGSVSGFSFEVERELLSHLEDRMVALFFFYKHTPYGLEKNGCIVKI